MRSLVLLKDKEVVSYYTGNQRLSNAVKYSSSNLNKFINKSLKLYDTFEVKYVDRIPSKGIVNKDLEFNDYKGVFKPIAILDTNNEILGIYSNIRECANNNSHFNFGTMQKRSQDGGVYMKKYLIRKISQYEYLIANKNLLNKKLDDCVNK